MGDGWSIAWRVHDAQFWGVPQRRKRIALVADFGGGAAPEVLFERESVSGNIEESREARQGTATDVERGIDKAISFQERGGKPGGGKGILIQHERTGALSTLNNQSVVYGMCSINSNSMKSSNPHSGIYKADTSRTLDLNGGNPACNQGGMMIVQGIDGYNQQSTGDVSKPLTNAATDSDHVPIVCIEGNGSRPSHRGDGYAESNTMYTLNGTEHHGVCKIYSMGHDIRSAKFTDDEITDPLTATDYKDPIKINDCRKTYQDITGTLDCGIAKGTGNQLADNDMFIANTSVVRRLTPLECERLQGYPDGWTNIGEWVDSKGKKHKDADSPRYKALGNSIALPFWEWMAARMVKYIDHKPTMASLFDGIGGFPLVFSRCGCTPIWASEIEEFPMAVTKLRFPSEEEQK
jgi:DNA (cytosine-5)-methyltransferase 1